MLNDSTFLRNAVPAMKPVNSNQRLDFCGRDLFEWSYVDSISWKRLGEGVKTGEITVEGKKGDQSLLFCMTETPKGPNGKTRQVMVSLPEKDAISLAEMILKNFR